jgi:hypothetical protein
MFAFLVHATRRPSPASPPETPRAPALLRSLLPLLLFVASLVTQPAGRADTLDIPNLPWTPRSDWINVRTDVTPAAVGDGITDDTAALQAALDRISDHGEVTASAARPRIVYLPPGTYRISQTLELRHAQGASVIGHGRSTRIEWHGAPGGRMFWQNGTVYTWYNGLSFDGRGIAAEGLRMASLSFFETGLRLENLAFRNFTTYGLHLEHAFPESIGGQANADSMISNSLFINCGTAIRLREFNVYAWNITGCEFRYNDVGVASYAGNFYVKNSHFAHSRVADVAIDISGPTSTVSRSTSYGSHRFVWDRGAIYPDIGATHIRDCRVAAWTDPAGAIQTVGGGTLMDTVFTEPPSANPPVRVIDSPRNIGNSLVVGGNVPPPGVPLVADETRGDLRIIEIPPGELGPSDLAATTRFLRSTATLRDTGGSVIFDAKRDFGAVGDGLADDTAALQATLDAARAHGQGAVAYFPSGDYRLSSTLLATGGGYSIEGSSLFTRLTRDHRWASGDTLLRIHNPDDLFVRSINALVSNALASTVLVTADQPGRSLALDRLITHDYSNLQQRGLRFDDLHPGTRIHIHHTYGCLQFTNAARAEILVDFAVSAIRIGGAQPVRDGFLRFVTTESVFFIDDNHGVVAEDVYHENWFHAVTATGSAAQPPGRIVFGNPGQLWVGWTLDHAPLRPSPPEKLLFNGYHGLVYMGGHVSYNSNPAGPGIVKAHGSAPLDLVIVGDIGSLHPAATWEDFGFDLTPNVNLTKLGRFSVRDWVSRSLPDQIAPGGLQAAATAWDELRRVGRTDLAWNFAHRVTTAPLPAPPPHPGPAAAVYRLRAAGSTGAGLYLTQPDFWAETLVLRAPATGDPYDTGAAVFQYVHLVPAANGRWTAWINRQDVNGIQRGNLRANGDNASITNGNQTIWTLLEAGDGAWRLEMPDGRRLHAPSLATNATVQAIAGPDSPGQRWLLEPVTLPPAPIQNFNAVLDSTQRAVLTWFHHAGLTTDFEIQRRPQGATTWTTVGLVAAANLARGNGRWVDPSNPTLFGEQQYRIRSRNPYGESFSVVRPVAFPEAPPSPLDTWRAAHFTLAQLADPAISGPHADPDGDGLPNLLEYALDLDPLTPAATPSAQSHLSDLSFGITFFRARPELTYSVEYGTDLAGWQTIATNPGAPGRHVTVPAPEPVSIVPRQFLRLRVTPAP